MAPEIIKQYPNQASRVNAMTVQTPDPGGSVETSTVNWRAIFAGVFLSLITYAVLMSLGVAIGSSSLGNLITGEGGAGALGWGSALWLILSVVISLFVGSFYSGRISGLIPTRVGRVQGGVVAALFFTFILWQVSALVGTLGRSAGSLVGFAGGAVGDLSQNPQVQQIVDQQLGDLNLKSSPEQIAQGVITRLLNGNPEGARNYLAFQAGVTRAEADQIIANVRTQVESTATQIGQTATQILSTVGWTLFGTLLLGLFAGSLGGGMGANLNLRRPVSRSDEKALNKQRTAA